MSRSQPLRSEGVIIHGRSQRIAGPQDRRGGVHHAHGHPAGQFVFPVFRLCFGRRQADGGQRRSEQGQKGSGRHSQAIRRDEAENRHQGRGKRTGQGGNQSAFDESRRTIECAEYGCQRGGYQGHRRRRSGRIWKKPRIGSSKRSAHITAIKAGATSPRWTESRNCSKTSPP